MHIKKQKGILEKYYSYYVKMLVLPMIPPTPQVLFVLLL